MPTISTPPTSPLCTTTTSEANQACSVIKSYSKTLCLALVSETWQDSRFGRPTCSTPPRLPTSLILSTSQAVDCHVIQSTTVRDHLRNATSRRELAAIVPVSKEAFAASWTRQLRSATSCMRWPYCRESQSEPGKFRSTT